jgi:tetratricopeptide (TPR) repeat protein
MLSWNLKDCSASLADEDKALSIDPNYAAAYTWRAVAEDCLGKPAEALADYQKALALDPSQWLVYYNLGVYYAKQADDLKSLQEFTLSTLVDPTRFEGWDAASQALQKLGRFDECIVNAGRAIALKTDFWQAHFDRGVCYEGKRYSRSAVTDLKLYVANQPEDLLGWFHYGNVLNENGDTPAALTAYNTALARSPAFAEAYVKRGLIYNTLKQYDRALSDFNAALKGGDLAEAFTGRGYAFYGLKQYAKALPDFQKSVALVPSECGYAGLVLTYTELGQFQDSLDAALNSTFSDPTCGGQPLLEAQARNYYALKDYDRALTYDKQPLACAPLKIGEIGEPNFGILQLYASVRAALPRGMIPSISNIKETCHDQR